MTRCPQSTLTQSQCAGCIADLFSLQIWPRHVTTLSFATAGVFQKINVRHGRGLRQFPFQEANTEGTCDAYRNEPNSGQRKVVAVLRTRGRSVMVRGHTTSPHCVKHPPKRATIRSPMSRRNLLSRSAASASCSKAWRNIEVVFRPPAQRVPERPLPALTCFDVPTIFPVLTRYVPSV